MSEAVRGALKALQSGRTPSPAETTAAFEALLAGGVAADLVADYLTVLRDRGETVADVVAAAGVMRAHARRVTAPAGVVDTCGTGGMPRPTLNTSTAAAIAAAAAGAKVAKHGNRSTPPKTGSADVLEALGVNLAASETQLRRCFAEAGVAFLFAQAHHAAVRHVAPVRLALGFRTIFNLVGPLANPAGAELQLIGVSDPAWVGGYALALRQLGSRRAWIVHGSDGLDEITACGATAVAELVDGSIRTFEVTPDDFGCRSASPESIAGGDVDFNAQALLGVLRGDETTFFDLVTMNGAAALVVAGVETDLKPAAARIRRALRDGSAAAVLERLKAASNG